MELIKNDYFSWRKHLFHVSLKKTFLHLQWLNLEAELTSASSDSSSDVSRHSEPSPTSKQKVYFKSSELSKTSLNLCDYCKRHLFKGCLELVSVSFSLDPGLSQEIPVFVVKGQEVTALKPGKVSKKPETQLLLLAGVSQHDSGNKLSSEFTFSLEFLREFSLPVIFSSLVNSNVGIIPDFKLFYVDPTTSSLHIFHQDVKTLRTQIQDFTLPAGQTTDQKVVVLDIHCVHKLGVFLVVLSAACTQSRQCFCCKFSPVYSDNETSQRFEVEYISLDVLFVSDFSQILKSIKLWSFSSQKDATTGRNKTALTMLTMTGFVLHFVSGVMSGCVSITDELERGEWTAELWGESTVKILNFSTAHRGDVSVIQINTQCFVISWDTEQVVLVPRFFLSLAYTTRYIHLFYSSYVINGCKNNVL